MLSVRGLELRDVASTPACTMVENPIDAGNVKANVAASFFTLEPFVTEDFGFFGAECLVKPRFEKTFRRALGVNECHGGSVTPLILALNWLLTVHTAKTETHPSIAT
jgi:hypothetical protein